jgi:hypothetical protein
MIEDATLVRIEVLMVEIGVTNEAIGSHELVGANEQVQSNAIIA